MEIEDFLAHYGVKGMKWGKRRAQASANRSANRARSKELNSKYETAVKAHGERRDASIMKARTNIAKADADYAVSKAKYKAVKKERGRQAARPILDNARMKRTITVMKNEELASVATGEEAARAALGAMAGIVVSSLFAVATAR